VPPALIDKAGLMAGMPVGPLALADEVSIELVHKIAQQTRCRPGQRLCRTRGRSRRGEDGGRIRPPRAQVGRRLLRLPGGWTQAFVAGAGRAIPGQKSALNGDDRWKKSSSA
jgi:hypothetical protein